jgi:hypothetical protein
MDERLYEQMMKDRVIYDSLNRDISNRDKAELVAKGMLDLDIHEQNQNLLAYTLEKEIKDDKLAQNLIFQFLAFKPHESIKDYNCVPDKLFFRFNFWDFDTFNTAIAVVNKPSSNITPTATPLTLQKELSQIYTKTDEKDMKVEIDFDPSDDPFIDYKDFINYMLNRQLFIEVFDADRLLWLGYIKVNLRDFLRQGKPNVFHTKEYIIFDEKFSSKGSIQLLIKNIGAKTRKSWNYNASLLKVLSMKDKYSHMNKKKKVKVNAMDLDSLTNQEKEILAQQILTHHENHQIENLDDKRLKLNVDPDTQKKLRVMKYIHGDGKKINIDDNKLKEISKKQERDSQFLYKLNQANKIKELKRNEIIQKSINETNKNQFNISLVCGQTTFLNMIVHNDSLDQDLLQVVISKPGEKKDDLQDNTLQLVTSPDEWIYYTEKYKLIKPNDFKSVSSQNHLIIRPNESIPLLLKLLSFDTKVANSNYVIWIYKQNGQPLYYFNITIVKVFPIIDHVFRFYLPENRYSTVKIPNPFKQDRVKTQKVLDYYLCSDPNIGLQLDHTTNDFYFKAKIQSEGFLSEFNLFLYLDELKTELYATWSLVLVSMVK